MLYTGKGDNGKTGTFGCDQRISKSSNVAESLGVLDEINSFLGICKVNSLDFNISFSTGKEAVNMVSIEGVIESVQQNLFIIQAQIAGADKTIDSVKVKEAEEIIGIIEKQLPPIKSFFVSGGVLLSANLDFARTLARRAERRVVAVSEEGKVKVDAQTMVYLNRLSSLLYALARFVNFKSGTEESSPKY